jgi:hypothetical protein
MVSSKVSPRPSHVVGQERAQRVVVALGEAVDHHFEGGACALDEGFLAEAGIGDLDLGQAGGQRLGLRPGAAPCAFARLALRQAHHGALGAILAFRRRLAAEGVFRRRRLAPGAPPEHVAQAQHKEAGKHGEQDNVDETVAVAHARHPDGNSAGSGLSS